MDTIDKYSAERKDWSGVNEQARAFAETFLKMAGRDDLARYYGKGRKAGIQIDWRFYFSDFSTIDNGAAGLEVHILVKKEEPSEPQNASDGKGKRNTNGFLSHIRSLFHR